MSLLRSESYRKGVLSSTVFNIAARSLGFINSLFIIYLFGSGIKTDIYFVILSTTIVVTSFINGVDSLVLIPESMRLRIRSGEKAERVFLNFFILSYSALGLLIALVVAFFPLAYYDFFTKYDEPFLASEKLMLIASSILIPVQLVTNLLIAILASHKYFTVPMMVGLINSIISLTILVVIRDQFSTFGALVAILIGNVVNIIWVMLYMHKKLKWNFFGGFTLPSRKIVVDIFLMQLNILPISIRSFVTIFFLSGLGAGVITAYNYGQQLAFIPELLLVSQIMVVLGVKFNEMSAKAEYDNLDRFFSIFLKSIFILMLPIGGIMALSSQEIVAVVFSFTNKVDAASQYNMAMVIAFLAMTLPARALDLTLTRLIMAQQKVKAGVVFAVMIHVLITVLVIAGISEWGLRGYLVAIFTGYNLLLPIIYYFLIRRVAPFIRYIAWIKESLPFVLFNGFLILGLYFLAPYYLPATLPLLKIVITTGLYVTIVLLYNYLFPYYNPINLHIKKMLHIK